jgi:hypothetical protein
VLDLEGRVAALAFDGNIHSLGGEYFYDGALNRTVSVTSTAIQAVLKDIYGMDGLLAELQSASPPVPAAPAAASAPVGAPTP